MKKIFDIKRFGKYFLYDLRNAKNHYWLSLIIEGCMPLILFFFFEVFNLLIGGSALEFPDPLSIMSFVIAIIGVGLSFSNKVYGGLTDKKMGSSWILLPASTFEKWLSMILITCVVLPAVLVFLLLGTDVILSLFFPGLYGESAISFLGGIGGKIYEATDGIVRFRFGNLFMLEWAEAILIMTLGAIYFKKSKIAKTILTCIGIGVVGSMLMISLGKIIGVESIENWLSMIDGDSDSVVKFITRMTNLANIAMWFWIAILGGGIYARLKTLKH